MARFGRGGHRGVRLDSVREQAVEYLLELVIEESNVLALRFTNLCRDVHDSRKLLEGRPAQVVREEVLKR